MKISEILVEAPNAKAIADLIKQNPDLTQAQIAALLKGGRQVAKPKDATEKMKQFVQQNKAELNKGQNTKVGGTIGKIAPGTLARDKNVAAQRDPKRQAGSYTQKTTTPTVPVAKPKAAPAPRGGGADRMPVAKPTAVAKPSAIVNPGAKAGQTPSAAGEFGSNKPRANIASTTNMSGAATNPQASAKFDQSKPTAVAKPAKKIGIQPGKMPSADTMDNRNK